MSDPVKNRPFVVMLNGHAACLKTTLSYLLAPGLQAGHVSTSLLGRIVSERKLKSFQELRERRYSRAEELVARYLQSGSSVVVDGTFSLRHWRERLYGIAFENGVNEVVAVFCSCSETSKLEERFRYRATNVDAPDAAANSMDVYFGSLAEYQPLDGDVVPGGLRLSILSFDSCFGTVKTVRNGPTAIIVARLIRSFQSSGSLSTPLFDVMKGESDRVKRIILLDGIGGSGKTTQTQLLRNVIAKRYDVEVFVQEEFSNSPLGHFIRGKQGQSLRVSPVADPLAQNFIVITDLLGSMSQTLPDNAICILDSGILSRLAHLQASRLNGFPEKAWIKLLETTARILDRTIVGESSPVSVFLDCPVDIAVSRLEACGVKITSSDVDFLRRLDIAYQGLLQKRDNDIVIIDGVGEPSEVNERVMHSITSRLGL